MNNKGICWACGKPATRALKPFHDMEHIAPEEVPCGLARQFCDECYEKHIAKQDEARENYLRLHRVLMFERAICKLEKQDVNLYEYKDIIDQLQEYVAETPDKFDSSHEIIAAIILIGHGIRCKPQYRVGKKIVDFLLPDLKVVLEVDGERHKYSAKSDRVRDEKIRDVLGLDWEVVRIPTGYLEQNAKVLPSAILQLKADMQRERRRRNGFLPENYSLREKATRNWRPEDECV